MFRIMVESTNLIKIGTSLGIIFDKRVVEKIYHWHEGSKLELCYDTKNDRIIIQAEKLAVPA